MSHMSHLIDKLLHKKHPQNESYGKHIDIVPKGPIPGEQLWVEPLSLNNDFELHNINCNPKPENVWEAEEIPALQEAKAEAKEKAELEDGQSMLMGESDD